MAVLGSLRPGLEQRLAKPDAPRVHVHPGLSGSHGFKKFTRKMERRVLGLGLYGLRFHGEGLA